MQDYGQKEFLVTKGIGVSLTVDGVLLPVEFQSKNPYSFEGVAVFREDETDDVYYGIEVEE